MNRKADLDWKRAELRQQEQRRDDAKSQIKRLRKFIAEMEAKPTLREPSGTLIQFNKKFAGNSTIYGYAAIKRQGLWYVTGRLAPNGVTWDTLVDFIIEDNKVTTIGYHTLASTGYMETT